MVDAAQEVKGRADKAMGYRSIFLFRNEEWDAQQHTEAQQLQLRRAHFSSALQLLAQIAQRRQQGQLPQLWVGGCSKRRIMLL